jgi:hypothetical protein
MISKSRNTQSVSKKILFLLSSSALSSTHRLNGLTARSLGAQPREAGGRGRGRRREVIGAGSGGSHWRGGEYEFRESSSKSERKGNKENPRE